MGGAVFPPSCLTWDQTMVEVMKIMVTSFKRSCAPIATLSTPDPVAGLCRPTPPPQTPGHFTGKSESVFFGVTAPFSWVLVHTRLCLCPPKLFPQPCVSCVINLHGLQVKFPRGSQSLCQIPGFIDYAKAFDCVDHNKLWKILKEMGIPDHLGCLLRNLSAGQEATVRTGHGTTDWLKIRKGVHQGCILSPCLFNLYAEYIIRNTGLDKAQAGNKISRRNINNLR